jgi:hypothetical protein
MRILILKKKNIKFKFLKGKISVIPIINISSQLIYIPLIKFLRINKNKKIKNYWMMSKFKFY